jgi:anti-anti-sigma factor
MTPPHTYGVDLSCELKRSRLHILPHHIVLVDLTAVDLADSMFLAGLIHLKRTAEDLGGQMILVCPSPLLITMLEKTRLCDYFAVASSPAEALAACDGPHAERGRRLSDASEDVPAGALASRD